MSDLDRAFGVVRRELADLELLHLLDDVVVIRSVIPSSNTLGFVYECGVPWLARLFGFEEGQIYIPINAPIESRPNSRLLDVLRHEMGHALVARFLDWYDRHGSAPYLRAATTTNRASEQMPITSTRATSSASENLNSTTGM